MYCLRQLVFSCLLSSLLGPVTELETFFGKKYLFIPIKAIRQSITFLVSKTQSKEKQKIKKLDRPFSGREFIRGPLENKHSIHR
jgi:hypothetical protein